MDSNTGADTFDTAFSVAASSITFGPGCLAEAGDIARGLEISRIGLLTDQRLAETQHVALLVDSLRDAGLEVAVYDQVICEPTDVSFKAAADHASEADVDGFISVGGGSVIDTTKAANLYSTYPADFLRYVNAPVGDGLDAPGPLKPHLACPTTSGTGSECTPIAVFDLLELHTKTGIQNPQIRPTHALIDPNTTATLPRGVVASSAFDVLSHALESYTARPYRQRAVSNPPSSRPNSQGANPWSDIGCGEALRILGRHLEQGVAGDEEARHQLMWAATLAGLAFGNSGCHAPHGMSYSVSGLVKNFRADGYPDGEPMIPHGMSVILSAPAVFRHIASTSPQRHRQAAAWLGTDVGDLDDADVGEALARRLIELMRATDIPNGLADVGYDKTDIDPLVEGAILQARLLENAPVVMDRITLSELYEGSLRYW